MPQIHRSRTTIVRFALLAVLCGLPGFASTLDWYTGDPLHTTTVGLVNGVFTGGQANVYDAFIVGAGGWTVTGVFSDDELLATTLVTLANWQIRSGVSSGNGGTLVASGTSAATQTQLFTIGTEAGDMIEVDNLSVSLAPGEYWLSVAPVTTGTGDVGSILPTADVNAVGQPSENGAGALTFDNYPAYTPSLNYLANPTSGGAPHDWSMGLYASSASATPEPQSFLLLGGGFLALAVAAKRGFVSPN